MPLPSRTLALACAVLALSACGERKPAKEKVNFMATGAKLEYNDIHVEAQPEPVAVVVADTWAAKMRERVKLAHDDLVKCRSEYLIPFQFNKMARRDIEFVSLSEMDDVCLEGNRDKKALGPKRIVHTLGEEHIGKHPALDRFVALATDQIEHYQVFSFMTKKIGAPDLGVVVDTAKRARDRVVALGGALDKAAADIAKWPDGQLADDDPQAVAKAVDAVAFQQQLVQTHGFFIADLAPAYDRFAARSWQGYDTPKLGALRRWLGIPTLRLQQDRARLASVQGDAKQLAGLRAYLDAVDHALQAGRKGLAHYETTPRDALSDKDPQRKAIETAAAAVAKIQAGWGVADPNAAR